MGWISEFTLDHFVHVDELRGIRTNWMGFYRRAYNSDKFRERYEFERWDEDDMKRLAITAANAAENYSPHESVIGPIEWVSKIYTRISLILLGLSLAFGTGIYGVLEILLTLTSAIESVFFALIPLELWVILMLYLHLLQMDEEFLQQFNRELRFGLGDIIRADSDNELLFCYYLWNAGLCDKRKAPMLMILLLFRVISERIYRRVMRSVYSNLDEFLDVDGYIGAIKQAHRFEIQASQE